MIGKFPEYLDAAEEMGVGSLKPGKGVIDFFTQAGAWQTLNQAYLDAQMFFGRSVYLSNVPLGQEGSGFGMELEYLMAHGVGPDQWQYVSLRFMGF